MWVRGARSIALGYTRARSRRYGGERYFLASGGPKRSQGDIGQDDLAVSRNKLSRRRNKEQTFSSAVQDDSCNQITLRDCSAEHLRCNGVAARCSRKRCVVATPEFVWLMLLVDRQWARDPNRTPARIVPRYVACHRGLARGSRNQGRIKYFRVEEVEHSINRSFIGETGAAHLGTKAAVATLLKKLVRGKPNMPTLSYMLRRCGTLKIC